MRGAAGGELAPHAAGCGAYLAKMRSAVTAGGQMDGVPSLRWRGKRFFDARWGKGRGRETAGMLHLDRLSLRQVRFEHAPGVFSVCGILGKLVKQTFCVHLWRWEGRGEGNSWPRYGESAMVSACGGLRL